MEVTGPQSGGSIDSNYPWLPQIDVERCIGCGECVVACPVSALELSNNIAFFARPAACDYYGNCERICPVGAITIPYQLIVNPGRSHASV